MGALPAFSAASFFPSAFSPVSGVASDGIAFAQQQHARQHALDEVLDVGYRIGHVQLRE
jgi:hypothetical protein